MAKACEASLQDARRGDGLGGRTMSRKQDTGVRELIMVAFKRGFNEGWVDRHLLSLPEEERTQETRDLLLWEVEAAQL